MVYGPPTVTTRNQHHYFHFFFPRPLVTCVNKRALVSHVCLYSVFRPHFANTTRWVMWANGHLWLDAWSASGHIHQVSGHLSLHTAMQNLHVGRLWVPATYDSALAWLLCSQNHHNSNLTQVISKMATTNSTNDHDHGLDRELSHLWRYCGLRINCHSKCWNLS